jgi:hypothetical protein
MPVFEPVPYSPPKVARLVPKPRERPRPESLKRPVPATRRNDLSTCPLSVLQGSPGRFFLRLSL